MKKPITKHYSPGSVLSIEPLLDSVIGDFCSILEKRFMDESKGSKEFDLGAYLAYGMLFTYIFRYNTKLRGYQLYMGYGWLVDFQQTFWIYGKTV